MREDKTEGEKRTETTNEGDTDFTNNILTPCLVNNLRRVHMCLSRCIFGRYRDRWQSIYRSVLKICRLEVLVPIRRIPMLMPLNTLSYKHFTKT